MKNLTYILDIGSSKISLVVCEVKKGKSVILTNVTGFYDGFMDGEFFSTEQLEQVIADLVNQISDRFKHPITHIHVGVPSEFCACVCKRITRNFVPSKKITDEDVEQLFDGLNDFKESKDYTITSFSPLQYELDGAVSAGLTNQRISQLVMDCSYVLVKNSFIELMQKLLNNCNINEIDFIATALAQAQFARKEVGDKLQPIAIVDVGHITTSVAVGKGDGLMMLSSFSLGGGHITADLMQVNNLNYADADAIKRKVALTIQTKKDEKYITYVNNKPIKALIGITNDIVNARVENIVNVIHKVLSVSDAFKDIPIYLTGDGLCNFRGVINIFEAVTNRSVQILKSKLHNGEDKYQTSKISLANIIGDLK